MTARPVAAGKLPRLLLGRLLAALPAAPPEVLLGPELGEDACAIEIPAGVLIAAADPITLTGADVGRYGVIVNANDVAVMGAAPRWFLATLLFPPATTDEDIERLFTGLRDALAQVGAWCRSARYRSKAPRSSQPKRALDSPPSTKRSSMPRRRRSTNPASASSTPPSWQPTSVRARCTIPPREASRPACTNWR